MKILRYKDFLIERGIKNSCYFPAIEICILVFFLFCITRYRRPTKFSANPSALSIGSFRTRLALSTR